MVAKREARQLLSAAFVGFLLSLALIVSGWMPSERSEQGKGIASEARQFLLCGFTFPRWLPSATRGNSLLMLSISLMAAERSEATVLLP
jgi:hypothetical protein